MERSECDEEIVKKADKIDASGVYTFLEKIRTLSANALRERSEQEITTNIDQFVIIRDGEKIIACGEIFQTNNTFTLELGALATDPDYQGQGWSDAIMSYAETFACRERKYLIIVTNNASLEKKLLERGYQASPIRYAWRQSISPIKSVYVKY